MARTRLVRPDTFLDGGKHKFLFVVYMMQGLTCRQGNIHDMISLDIEYLKSLVDPVAPWGEQLPHK